VLFDAIAGDRQLHSRLPQVGSGAGAQLPDELVNVADLDVVIAITHVKLRGAAWGHRSPGRRR
jgi:hypothetical protein